MEKGEDWNSELQKLKPKLPISFDMPETMKSKLRQFEGRTGYLSFFESQPVPLRQAMLSCMIVHASMRQRRRQLTQSFLIVGYLHLKSDWDTLARPIVHDE